MSYAVKELNKTMARLIKADLLDLLPQYKKAIEAIEENKHTIIDPCILHELNSYKKNIERGLSGNWSGYEAQKKRQEKKLKDVNEALKLLRL